MDEDLSPPERRIFTVTELTRKIRSLLESSYPFVWLTGEVSNFRAPVSGHFYFTLKDPGAQISAVMFRAQNRTLNFELEDGLSLLAMGRINVYEPKGIYQIIIEYLEPEGVGILQLAYEQLKAKLAAQGLFEEKHKRALPFLPQRIAVVTSPTGAVIRDILNVIDRRYPNVGVVVAPVRVQGEGAVKEIAEALYLLNEQDHADVIIVARGGGSLEDLQAFNSELVARAIFSSQIPVVSAVGHETDYTIADFTADVRAPTPSAAAELIVPVKQELVRDIERVFDALKRVMSKRLTLLRERALQVSGRLIHPRRQIADYRLRLDDVSYRVVRGFWREFEKMRDRLHVTRARLTRCSPQLLIQDLDTKLQHYGQSLSSAMQFYLQSKGGGLDTTVARLKALSPLAILERGYSVTRVLPEYALIKDVRQVNVGQRVEVTVSKGAMVCRIERKQENGQTNI
ncbi:MAG: exodeoxyribonuclease VII large subunit [Desulfobacterales bacterium]|nr:MAG: exodeoxyribonuclease VII large subunit [Desulfobacterales bacterium]